jgi:hypothetical protein
MFLVFGFMYSKNEQIRHSVYKLLGLISEDESFNADMQNDC